MFESLMNASRDRNRFQIAAIEREAFKIKAPKEVKDFIRLIDNQTYFFIRGDVAAAATLGEQVNQSKNCARILMSRLQTGV